MNVECDMLVVGSGAAGLTAALTAAQAGLSVIVAEKAAVIGGTTALSEGMVWIPGSRQAQALGVFDPPEAALEYIQRAAGTAFEPIRSRAFVESAAEMLAFVEDSGGPSFTLSTASMDYHPDWPGATAERARSWRCRGSSFGSPAWPASGPAWQLWTPCGRGLWRSIADACDCGHRGGTFHCKTDTCGRRRNSSAGAKCTATVPLPDSAREESSPPHPL